MHGQAHTRVTVHAAVGELTALSAAKSPTTDFVGDGWGVVVGRRVGALSSGDGAISADCVGALSS
jgi:hypothetical protein